MLLLGDIPERQPVCYFTERISFFQAYNNDQTKNSGRITRNKPHLTGKETS